MADYCTPLDVQQKGRLDIAGDAYDATLAALIGACSRWIDAYCRVPENGFNATATATATHYFGRSDIGTDDNTLMLDAPLLSVARLANGDGAVLASDTYRLLPRNGLPKWGIALLSGYAWQWAVDGEIAVTGVWGAAATVPEPVREACIVLAAWMFKRYQAGLQDVTASPEIGQVIYAESVPKQVKALLAPYRRVLI